MFGCDISTIYVGTYFLKKIREIIKLFGHKRTRHFFLILTTQTTKNLCLCGYEVGHYDVNRLSYLCKFENK